jgi:hypothetical protein
VSFTERLAADQAKRDVFARLGEHINGIASEIEKVFEPEKPTTEETVPAAVEKTSSAEGSETERERATASEPSDAARPRHKFPWLKVTTFRFRRLCHCEQPRSGGFDCCRV